MNDTKPMAIIKEAFARGDSALNEYDSKRFLSSIGIPVNRETLVHSAAEAGAEAERMGFPVVLKACGARLHHKSDIGGVVLNVETPEQARNAADRLLRIEGCEAVLVQEMVQGSREIVCGMTRDQLFGPCVMFGLGGVFTELIEDVAFRLAPLTSEDARDMAHAIRTRKLLGAFRGESQIDIDGLVRILVALGELALRFDDVSQIDINPLKVLPDGKVKAVDALVVLGTGERRSAGRTDELKPGKPGSPGKLAAGNTMESLAPFFQPAGVVIIGASGSPGKPGHEVIRNIQANGYPGKLYLVNPKANEILGLPVSPSIESLPEKPDLAVLILPAEKCPQALRECAAKGIKHVVISAGGFAEVDEARAQIQRELVQVIRENEMRVMGPNTSGHISTPHRFTSTFFPLGNIRPGRVSYIAQTGNFATHTMKYILSGEHFGVSRVIGLGNAIDIDESEALEYLGSDPETASILIYLESFKRPRRFLEIAREITRSKPVVMLKGGATEAGKRAAVAHTASMAAEDRIVDGMLRQAGIVRIWDYTHLILAGKALSMMPLPKGNRVSFLAPSGAMLVAMTDLCTRLGLDVPGLEPQNLKRIQEISPPFIRMRNPVDIWAAATTHGVEFGYREGMEAVLNDHNIDAAVAVLMLTRDTGIPSYDFIVDVARKYPQKPVIVTFSGEKQYMDECREYLEPRGIATFPEIEQPFEVLSILARCHAAMNR
jgi:acyl-CoA synthetase (NDP forming)